MIVRVGSHHVRSTYADLRMAHQNTGAPLLSWQILMLICEGDGRLTMPGDPEVVKVRLSEFRKSMKGLFGLEDDPFDDYKRRRGGRKGKWHAHRSAPKEIEDAYPSAGPGRHADFGPKTRARAPVSRSARRAR